MIRHLTIAAVCCLLLAGCSSWARIHALEDDMDSALSKHQTQHAAAIEAEILRLATKEYGPDTAPTYNARAATIERLACWGQTDEAIAKAETLLRDIEAGYGAGSDTSVIAWYTLSRAYLSARRWNDAGEAAGSILRICQPRYGYRDRHTQCSVYSGALVEADLVSAGYYEACLENSILGEKDDILPPDHTLLVSALTQLGRRHAQAGNVPEALWYFRRCVDETHGRYESLAQLSHSLWKSDSGDVEVSVVDGAHSFHSQSPKCLEDLIEIQRKLGHEREAASLAAWQKELWRRGPDLEQALVDKKELADEAWGDDSRTSLEAQDLAFYYAHKGRNDDAIAAYEEAIGYIERASAGGRRAGACYGAQAYVDELLGLGDAYAEAGRYDEAAATFDKAAAIAAEELNPRHEWRLEPLARRARALAAAGRDDEAARAWRRYLAAVLRQRGPKHADMAQGLRGLSAALRRTGQTVEAERAQREAAAIQREVEKQIVSTGELPVPMSLNSTPPPAN